MSDQGEGQSDRVQRTVRELQMRAAQLQDQTVLAAAAAHDLSNLLSAVIHNVELLRLRAHEPPDTATLDRLDQSIDRACQLSRAISERSADGLGMDESLDLHDLARDAQALGIGLLGAGDSIAVERMGGERPSIVGSRQQLLHATFSLVEVALQGGARQVGVRVGTDEVDAARLAAAWAGDRMAAGDAAFVEVLDDAPARGHLPGACGDAPAERDTVLRSIVHRHGGAVEVLAESGRQGVRILLPTDATAGPAG